jgi:hypothetical protein
MVIGSPTCPVVNPDAIELIVSVLWVAFRFWIRMDPKDKWAGEGLPGLLLYVAERKTENPPTLPE